MNVSPLPVVLALVILGTFARVHSAEQTTGASRSEQAKAERPKVDLNTAKIPELEAIPEIGTDFANAVYGARPFKSVDEVDRILKIGPEKMKALRLKVWASPVKPTPPPPARSTPDNLKDGGKPNPVNEGKASDRKPSRNVTSGTPKPAPRRRPNPESSGEAERVLERTAPRAGGRRTLTRVSRPVASQVFNS